MCVGQRQDESRLSSPTSYFSPSSSSSSSPACWSANVFQLPIAKMSRCLVEKAERVDLIDFNEYN